MKFLLLYEFCINFLLFSHFFNFFALKLLIFGGLLPSRRKLSVIFGGQGLTAENKALFSAGFFCGQKPPKISLLPPKIAYFRRQMAYFRRLLAAKNVCSCCSVCVG
jgi:hypothetical protein